MLQEADLGVSWYRDSTEIVLEPFAFIILGGKENCSRARVNEKYEKMDSYRRESRGFS